MKPCLKKSFQSIPEEELLLAWQKIQNNPGKTLQRLYDEDSEFLHDFIITIYHQGILQKHDWALLQQYIDCRMLFDELLQNDYTNARFKSDILSVLDQAIRDSCKIFQPEWSEPLIPPSYQGHRFSFAPDEVNVEIEVPTARTLFSGWKV